MSDRESLALISPYRGKLINLLIEPDEIDDVKVYAASLPWIQVSERSICDLELLAIGAFSPLVALWGKLITNV
jgi:sulfate adenylyltransferase